MRKKLKKYYVNPEDSAVLAMSVVDAPAVESEFVYLSKQKVDKFIALEENTKHMIYGCALRPDFPIYRNDGVEEYYLEFSKDAVEKLARNFMVNGLQQNFTQAHKSEVEGITITESWIKADMEKDKSVALGLDAELPVGTWLIGAYCNNADIWDKVKAGTYHGFSVEAIVNVDELQFEEQTPDVAPTVTETVETPVVETPVVEETPKSSIEDRLDKIWEVVQTMLPKEEPNEPGNASSLPSNPLEKAIQEPQEEPTVEEPTTEPQEEEKPSEEPKIDINVLNETIENLKSELEALKEKNHLLESEKEALSNKVDELGKQPSAKPADTNAKPDGDTFRNWRDKMAEMLR